jgi:DNA repair protein RecN (Recombination protein N)
LLLELTVHNFALIEELCLELGPGLNVLTGETGAGKSIIIDAVNLVLGGRASTDFIREPADKAKVEGVFETPKIEQQLQTLTELGVDIEEDGILIMTREVSLNGRNLCRINGRTTTLANFRRVGEYLVDLHGQHEHQSLLNPERNLDLLDNYGGGLIPELRSRIAGCYRELQTVIREQDRWAKDEQEVARRHDLLTFQVEEIDSARLIVGENDGIQQEKIVLQNAERLAKGATLVYQLIYDGNRQHSSAYDQLAKAVAELKIISVLDTKLKQAAEVFEGVLYQTEEGARELRHYLEKIVSDPNRLEEIEERLNLIRQLKRKYGNTIEEILQYGREAALELEKLVHNETILSGLQDRRIQLENKYSELAEKLTVHRQQAAVVLEEGINMELAFLGMPNARFTVAFDLREQPLVYGQDEIEFLLSPNPGEPLKPLARIASGGEMSRIMLALKTLLAKVDQVPTLIFDEIDTGIGGRALESVAARLGELAGSHQVICVTHAAQIAGWADNHFYIEKQVEDGRTQTRISLLLSEARILEMSRMLGGDTESLVSRQHALEMLERAKVRKGRG